MRLNISSIIFVLAFLIDIEGAIAHDKISLVHMVPDSWIDGIKAWDSFLLFCGTSLIGLLAAPAAFARRMIPPAKAVAMFLVAVILTLFLVGESAKAADNLPAITLPTLPVKASTFTPTSCSPTSCSGLYVGLGITGNGTNADILGSGLSQSVFAAGAMVDGHVGYQLWNGTYLFAVEAGLGNEFQSGPIQINGNTLIGYEGIKLGGALSGILGQSTTTTGTTVSGQSAGALPVFSSLANAEIAPYAWLGMIQRNGYNQGTYGAGIEYALAQNWNLDVRYEYAPALGTLAALQQVKLGLNFHFGSK